MRVFIHFRAFPSHQPQPHTEPRTNVTHPRAWLCWWEENVTTKTFPAFHLLFSARRLVQSRQSTFPPIKRRFMSIFPSLVRLSRTPTTRFSPFSHLWMKRNLPSQVLPDACNDMTLLSSGEGRICHCRTNSHSLGAGKMLMEKLLHDIITLLQEKRKIDAREGKRKTKLFITFLSSHGVSIVERNLLMAEHKSRGA